MSGLNVIANATLNLPISGRLFSFESRTDLIAYVNCKHDVCIARLGGQQTAFIPHTSIDGPPTCIQWHVRGKSLKIGTANGSIHNVSSESGRLISTSMVAYSAPQVPDHDRAAVTCIGSATNSAVAVTALCDDADGQTVEQWLSKMRLDPTYDHGSSPADLTVSPYDLPQQLAMIDVEVALPRLSSLAVQAKTTLSKPFKVAGLADAAYSLVSTSTRQHDMAMQVHVVAQADNVVRIELDGIFYHELTLDKPHNARSSIPLQHCADEKSSRHVILQAEVSEIDTDTIGSTKLGPARSLTYPQLSVFQVPFSVSGGQHTPIILSKTAQLHGLSIYLSLGAINMQAEWNAHTSLPSRFIESISESLAEKDEADLKTQLFSLAMTGHCSSTITEWLRDVLQERGHKRWDAAVTSLYSSLGQSLRQYLMPALERCTLAATQLRGLATYYAGTKTFDVAPDCFTRIVDAVTCAQALVHEAMRIVSSEERAYRVFSQWLRRNIDLAGTEPGSAGAIEIQETEATSTDMPSVLDYLEGPLMLSGLAAIVPEHVELKNGHDGPPNGEGTALDNVMSAIKQSRNDGSVQTSLLNLPVWLKTVVQELENAFEQIQQWQQASWQAPVTIELPDESMSAVLDMRMFVTEGEAHMTEVHLAALDADQSSSITIMTVRVDAHRAHGRRAVHLGDDAEVRDLKIIADKSTLVLVRAGEETRLVSLAAESATEVKTQLNEANLDVAVLHNFPHSDGFVPVQIRVSGDSSRLKILLLDAHQRRWQVLDMRPRT